MYGVLRNELGILTWPKTRDDLLIFCVEIWKRSENAVDELTGNNRFKPESIHCAFVPKEINVSWHIHTQVVIRKQRTRRRERSSVFELETVRCISISRWCGTQMSQWTCDCVGDSGHCRTIPEGISVEQSWIDCRKCMCACSRATW